jgi:hypothetical protein
MIVQLLDMVLAFAVDIEQMVQELAVEQVSFVEEQMGLAGEQMELVVVD